MNIFNSSNWLFVSFEQGAGGHRIARELAEQPDIYWYAHPDNDLDETEINQRKNGSMYHFNRYVPGGHLPPPYDYVKEYIDEEEYYTEIFEPKFIEAGGDVLLQEYKLPYCTHLLPHEIVQRFPNAQIVNVTQDPEITAKRFMDVASLFPGFVKHKDFIDSNNHRILFLSKIYNIKPDFTTRDVWAVDKYGKLWEDKMHEILYTEKLKEFSYKNEVRIEYENSNISR